MHDTQRFEGYGKCLTVTLFLFSTQAVHSTWLQPLNTFARKKMAMVKCYLIWYRSSQSKLWQETGEIQMDSKIFFNMYTLFHIIENNLTPDCQKVGAPPTSHTCKEKAAWISWSHALTAKSWTQNTTTTWNFNISQYTGKWITQAKGLGFFFFVTSCNPSYIHFRGLTRQTLS